MNTYQGVSHDLRELELRFLHKHPIPLPEVEGRFSITPTMYFVTTEGWDSDSGDTIYVSTIAEVTEILEAEPVVLVHGYRYEVYDHLLRKELRSHRPYPRY